MERELGFEFVLIPNQDILIFTDDNLTPGGDDGFTYIGIPVHKQMETLNIVNLIMLAIFRVVYKLVV